MGDKTKIEWTDATWNPVTGCTKVSQGCKNCYAERVFNRAYWNKPVLFAGSEKGGPIYRPREFADVQCHPERLEQPLHWKKPRRIFVNSMSDLFHESVPDQFISGVFQNMECATQHVFQILTKRSERMQRYMTWRFQERNEGRFAYSPPKHIHLGVSCEDQPTADERIRWLLQTLTAVRFVSLEPLLGPINTKPWITGIDWVIVGGESGPGARPMHPDWARSIRDQCVAAGVPFFFKQWGEWAPTEMKAGGDLGGDMRRGLTTIVHAPGNPEGYFRRGDEMMSRVGKKAAGALLDGREWREFPKGSK
jgi:protein gp37